MEKAGEYFRLATEKDHQFARAYAREAMAHGMRAYFGYTPYWEAYPKVRSAAKRAFELDNLLADPHVAFAMMRWFQDWNLDECGRELEHAVVLNPNDPFAHWSMAIFQASMRAEHRRAAAERELALALDPLSILIRSTLCWLPYWARDFDKAVEQCRVTLELNENAPLALYVLSAALRVKGALDEAIATLEQAAARFRDPLSLAYLGMAYGIAGRRDQAQNVFHRMEESCAPHRVRSIIRAFVYTGLGENGAAIDHIEKAFDEHDAFVLWLRISPDWDLLRNEPRFRKLLLRCNFTALPSTHSTMEMAEIPRRTQKSRPKSGKQG